MSLNTILTAVSGIIKASHVTDILTALRLQFVGRNSDGEPASGQDLGTATYPWGEGHIDTVITDEITLDGGKVDVNKALLPRNGIISCATRTDSEQPDFIRADGTTNTVTILATAVPLKVIINDTIVEITSDIEITGISPSTTYRDTTIDNPNISGLRGTKYLGQEGLKLYLLDTATVNPRPYFGETVVFFAGTSTPSVSAVGIGTLNDANGLIAGDAYIDNGYTAYWFDNAGSPIPLFAPSYGDDYRYADVGWIFLQDNGLTTEISTTTPIYSFEEPSLTLGGQALTAGVYWFDESLNTWKRYNGSVWVVINRVLLGQCVTWTDSVTYATRSFDLIKEYKSDNTIDLQRISDTEFVNRNANTNINVYGTPLISRTSQFKWDTVLTGARIRYFYLGSDAKITTEDTRPVKRGDLQGWYHPFHAWRCVGVVDYDTQTLGYKIWSDFDAVYFCNRPDSSYEHFGSGDVENLRVLQAADLSLWDNLERWDSVNRWYPTNDGEQYRVTFNCRVDFVSEFTGSVNDEILKWYISLYDITNSNDDGSDNPFGADPDYPNEQFQIMEYEETLSTATEDTYSSVSDNQTFVVPEYAYNIQIRYDVNTPQASTTIRIGTQNGLQDIVADVSTTSPGTIVPSMVVDQTRYQDQWFIGSDGGVAWTTLDIDVRVEYQIYDPLRNTMKTVSIIIYGKRDHAIRVRLEKLNTGSYTTLRLHNSSYLSINQI